MPLEPFARAILLTVTSPYPSSYAFFAGIETVEVSVFEFDAVAVIDAVSV